MGIFIEIDGKQREVVKVKSDNPSHAGYYTTYRDQMKPGEEEYFEPQAGEMKGDPGPGVCIDPQGLDPIKTKPAAPPVKHRRSRK